MFYGGYLTIKSVDEMNNSIVLGVPNSKIKYLLKKNLFASIFKTKASSTCMMKISSKIFSTISSDDFSHKITKNLEEIFTEALANIAYDQLTCEAAFRNVFDLLLEIKFEDVRKEVHTNRGRIDTVIMQKTNLGKLSKIIIIEYKFGQKNKKKISKKEKLNNTDSKIISTNTDIAIEQIKEKGYIEAFSAYGVPVFIIGILLSSEKKIKISIENILK
jgi:hypothetical protein